MIVYLFSGHRESDKVAYHASVDPYAVLVAECSDDSLDGLERNESYLIVFAFLDLLLQVLSISANQLHEFLVLRGVAEERDGFLADRHVLFLAGGRFGEELVGRSWGRAHK